MNRQRPLVMALILLAVTLAAGGAYMFRANAQGQAADPAIRGAQLAADVATPTPPPAPGGLGRVQTYGFDAQPSGWRALDTADMPDGYGVWTTRAGKLAENMTVSGSGGFDNTMYLAPVDTAGRASVSAQVYPQGNQVVGLVFRASDQGYYLFRVFRGDGAEMPVRRQLQRYDAATGIYTTLAEDRQGRGYALGKWQELRVDLDGDAITCSFDGERVFQVRDGQLAGGQAGVYTLALGEVFFDNFAVAQP